MEPRRRDLPVGFRFRPTNYEISTYFLKKKALGQPITNRIVPEECHDIFSRHPRDLPGYPEEDHYYYFCRKRKDQVSTTNSQNVWTPIREATDVLDRRNNNALVGIKLRFTLVEHEQEEDNWFLDEISLPETIAETDWVFCHIFLKIKPEFVDLPILESESEEEEEE
ncbi:unnamed protein product [Microthlaspi erraticum]|uniref:NAC domain-containing protein n=1 Tax=Microthlaspi erraticum TaxID=1685480 RepID=A0A6D2K685_9BRAS|nr:unnamed protein product [Microthlaspi erraticum]